MSAHAGKHDARQGGFAEIAEDAPTCSVNWNRPGKNGVERVDMFKECTSCKYRWEDRNRFLDDPNTELTGYQANYGKPEAGYFLFGHAVENCMTTLAIAAGEFTDMHDGPIFQERLKGTDRCPGLCQHEHDLSPCPEKCECAFVRDVLDKVNNWPKARKPE